MPRRYRVDVTRAAERDIATIHAHIGRDNLPAAAAWLDSIERNIASLEQWPQRCPIVPEASDLDLEYRHLVNAPYRTIFRIAGRRVIIVRVIHQSGEWPPALPGCPASSKEVLDAVQPIEDLAPAADFWSQHQEARGENPDA